MPKKLLLASPFFSQHFDSGHFFARAFSNLGCSVILWDYRLQTNPPIAKWDAAVVFKGGRLTLNRIEKIRRRKVICYYPDNPKRVDNPESSPENLEYLLRLYNKVFMPVYPCPFYAEWLPTGYDEDIHQTPTNTPVLDVGFIGTATKRKAHMLSKTSSQIFGNGWGEYPYVRAAPPVYLHNYVNLIQQFRISVNIHREDIGVNRRLFELGASSHFLLCDDVPGTEQIFGPELKKAVSFNSPEELSGKVQYYLSEEGQRKTLAYAIRDAIKPFTYTNAAKRILSSL